ncbi:ester cyclase [Nonomuraea sp. MG754425]|uniref:ester cyclase n=1 Tax=Nonomuraea sp. MG754425 TaxID=2570319 RepID=UPI001F305795|nr:ester cyclase [Nonomuraea sp. MG754425]MCF6470986.1 ester cyclase [Nonomuraea sp. MG754425]
MTTTEVATNKAALRRFHDAVSTGDADVISRTIDEIIHPDVLIHTPLPLATTGRQSMKEVLAALDRAFPDLDVHIEDVIAEGDKVVTRNTVTGTQQGEYMGIAPTGKTVTYQETLIVRFADGQVAETWAVVDVLSVLRQLGAFPAP